jgi:hypothetical protein
MNDLSFRVNIFEKDYLNIEQIIDSVNARLDSVERKINKKKNKLNGKIKELQNYIVFLTKNFAEIANYRDESLKEESKIMKCAHTNIKEDTIVPKKILEHDQIFKNFYDINHPHQELKTPGDITRNDILSVT